MSNCGVRMSRWRLPYKSGEEAMKWGRGRLRERIVLENIVAVS